MARKLLGVSVLFLAVTAFGAAPETANTSYEIKFDRPQKVGQIYDLTQSIEITQGMQAAVKGKEVQKQSQSAKYVVEGTMEVLEVDAQGRCSKFHLTIKKLQATESDAPLADAIKSELGIEATYGDNKIDCKIVKADEQLPEIAGHALSALPIFVPRAAEPKFTNDELYGSKDRKKVGDKWDMDIKGKGEALGLDPEKTTGTVKLESVKTDHGIQWLQIAETLDSTEINDPNLGKAKDAKLAVEVVDSIPVDTANPSEKSQSTRHLHGTFNVPQQDGTTAKVTLDRLEKRNSTMILTTPHAETAPAK